MTVEILVHEDGYEVKAATFEHLFADRSKALLVAHVVALTEATNQGRSVALVLPESWKEQPAVEEQLP